MFCLNCHFPCFLSTLRIKQELNIYYIQISIQKLITRLGLVTEVYVHVDKSYGNAGQHNAGRDKSVAFTFSTSRTIQFKN
jgi:hypothetical protein